MSVVRYASTVVAVPLALAAGGCAGELAAWLPAHWPTGDAGMFAAGCIGGLVGCINLLVFGLWRACHADAV